MNRLSKDISVVDSVLPTMMNSVKKYKKIIFKNILEFYVFFLI
jgi:hypothetical protein